MLKKRRKTTHTLQKRETIFQRLINHQEPIILIYVALMLVPNLLLAITEPYTLSTVVASILLPMSVYLVMGILVKRVGWVILFSFPFIILCAFQLVLLYLFGGSIIAVDMFTNLFTTNTSEAGELLGQIWPSVVGVCLLYLPLIALGIHSLRVKEVLSTRFRRRGAGYALLIFLIGSGFALHSNSIRPEFGIRYHVFPVNVCYNIKLTLDKWNMSLNYPKTSCSFSYLASKDTTPSDSNAAATREIYVLVIGEASRAANWGLLGYERETNPFLQARGDIIPFHDIITQNNATHKSVPLLLSPSSAEHFREIYQQKSVITAFKEAGFRTLFLSNQGPNRSLIDFFAAESDRRINISTGTDSTYLEDQVDGLLMPYLQEALRENNDNLFLVIHTYGSHFNFFKRYPRSQAHFLPDETSSVNRHTRQTVVNAYDNSIRYTDSLLNEVINTLAGTQARTALLYCADHGEDLMDDARNRFLHASPTPTYYQLHVAGFAWFSESYRQHYGSKAEMAVTHMNAPATTANIFHTIVDMASIRTPYLDSSQSLVSPSYQHRTRYYLNDHDYPVAFFNSGLTRYDFDNFAQHKINYNTKDVRSIAY